MLRRLIAILSIFLLTNCIVKKKTTYSKSRTITVEADANTNDKKPKSKRKVRKNETAERVVKSAMAFTGTRYKYGGTTKRGMDCSGLVHVSFIENGIEFPRVSYQMADEGKKVSVGQVQKGDLLFFKTSRKGKRINHVGLVVAVDGDDIRFIHSTTSRGVIVSSLREGYWNSAFVKASRVL